MLATPPEVARALDVRKQQLLGFGALGMLELRSPIQRLRDDIV